VAPKQDKGKGKQEVFKTSLIAKGHQSYVPDPPNEDEKRVILKSQVLIPFSIKEKTYAFLGPQTSNPPSFFSDFPEEKIYAFSESYNLSFLKSPNRVFRSSPPMNKEYYIPWLDRLEKTKGTLWKSLGIYDLIQFSKCSISYNYTMLLSSFFFWDRLTNTFHTPYGMLTPTLFDLAAITGLKPSGVTFRPDIKLKKVEIRPKMDVMTYNTWLSRNNKETGEVSNEEHIAFLMYWLSTYVFCSKSLQIPRATLTLAQLINEGERVCLSKILLGSLYKNLSETVDSLRSGFVKNLG